MRDWRIRTGILLGLAAAALLAAAVETRRLSASNDAPPAHGPVLSECDGALRELVIHYVPKAAPIAATAYRELFRQLARDVTVYVLCPDEAAFADLRTRVGAVPCRLVPVPTGHPMTCWSRDRWLALAPASPGGPTVLLAPREEACSDIWPERRGDQRVARDLEAAMPARLAARRSLLAFDAGDFVADSQTVFVTPRVARRNLGGPVASPAQLRRVVEAALQREVVLLSEAPPHHAGMFMMLVGDRTVLVGDPGLAADLLPRDSSLIPSPDFSRATQHQFDAVAARCAAVGYRVVRIPVVPDADGRTYLTYLNALIDQRDGGRTVYMPTYRGADTLNRAAADVWRSLGYRVRLVDCTDVFPHFGSLHCLVNVLARSSLD